MSYLSDSIKEASYGVDWILSLLQNLSDYETLWGILYYASVLGQHKYIQFRLGSNYKGFVNQALLRFFWGSETTIIWRRDFPSSMKAFLGVRQKVWLHGVLENHSWTQQTFLFEKSIVVNSPVWFICLPIKFYIKKKKVFKGQNLQAN